MAFEIKVIDQNELIPLTDAFKPRFDDTIVTIKQKIFAGQESDDPNDVLFWPEFTRLKGLESVPKGIVLAEVTNKNSLEVEDLVTLLEDETPPNVITSSQLDQLLVKHQKNYPELTKSQLTSALQLAHQKPEQSFIRNANKLRETLIKTFKKEQTSWAQLPVNELDNGVVNKLVNRSANGQYKTSLLNALVKLPPQNLKGQIDIFLLFNQLNVNEDIPFISIQPTTKEPPLFKIWEKIKDTHPEVVRRWLIVEKGVEEQLKLPQGLTVRFKVGNNEWALLQLFRSGLINVRCSWKEEQHANKADLERCLEPVRKFTKLINTQRAVFTGDSKLVLGNPEILQLDESVQIKIDLSREKLRNKIAKDTKLQFFFALDQESKLKDDLCKELKLDDDECKKLRKPQVEELAKKKGISLKTSAFTRNQLNLRYNRVSKRPPVLRKTRTGEIKLEKAAEGKIVIIIKSSGITENATTILLKDSKSFQQTQFVIDNLISTIRITEDKITSPIKSNRTKSKLKILKEHGISVDSRSCQEPRQPIVSDNANPIEDSYPLIVNGTRLVCTNPKAPYPGYTIKGVVCCFPTDQRQKPNFKKHHDPNQIKDELTEADLQIGKQTILTDKVLQPGRLGILPDKINELFQRQGTFRRVGVFQEQDSFLHAVFAAVKDHLRVTSFSNFKKSLIDFISKGNVFRSLQNGNIGKQMTLVEYKNLLATGDANHKMLLDAAATFAGVNIWIFDEQAQNIVCYSDWESSKEFALPNKPSVFLLLKDRNYEPIFEFKAEPIKVFSARNKLSLLVKDLYNFSCTFTPAQTLGFKHPLGVKLTIEKLDVPVVFQIINAQNEIVFVVVKVDDKKVLIPVRPSGAVTDVPVLELTDDTLTTFKRNATVTQKSLNKIAEKTGLPIKVHSQLLKGNVIEGFVLENGMVVPVKFKKAEQRRINIPVSKANFSASIDNAIKQGLTVDDPRVQLMNQINTLSGLRNQARLEISAWLGKNTLPNGNSHSSAKNTAVKERLVKIVTDAKTSQSKKVAKIKKEIVKILKIVAVRTTVKENVGTVKQSCSGTNDATTCNSLPWCKWVQSKCKMKFPKRYRNTLANAIAHEIVTDTVKMAILRQRLVLNIPAAQQVSQVKGEVVLFDLNSVQAWLKGEPIRRVI